MSLNLNLFTKFLLCLIFTNFIFFGIATRKSHATEVFIIAKTNNQVITNLDLLDRYHFLTLTSKIRAQTKQEKLMFLNQLLQKMIDEKLQTEEAIKSGIEIDPEEINESLEKIAQDQGRTTQKLKNFLSANNISYANYIEQIKSQILWNKLIIKTLPAKIKISNSDLEEIIELNKINANSAQFLLAEIYIPFDYKISNDKIEAKELASKLAFELKNGRDFKNLAKQFSRSPTAEFNGEIGWVGKNDIDKRIYEQVSKLKINEISLPIMMDNGYYIFKLLNKRIINNLTDDDLKEMRNVIFSKKIQNAAKSYLIDLRKKSYVDIDYQKLSLMI